MCRWCSRTVCRWVGVRVAGGLGLQVGWEGLSLQIILWLQECEVDPQLFVPPEHIALAQLPFPVGVRACC